MTASLRSKRTRNSETHAFQQVLGMLDDDRGVRDFLERPIAVSAPDASQAVLARDLQVMEPIPDHDELPGQIGCRVTRGHSIRVRRAPSV